MKYAQIDQGRVSEMFDTMPELAPGQCALIMEVADDVKVGWRWTPDGCVPDPNENTLAQIAALEAQQTPRRLREATITEDGKIWLEELEGQISTLRNQLI